MTARLTASSLRIECLVALGMAGFSIGVAGCAAPDPEGNARDSETPPATTAPAVAKPKGMTRAEVAAARADAETRYDGFLKNAKSDAERKMLEEQRVKSRKLFDEFERKANP